MKGRSDVIVLTLNLDQEIGLVEPYVKKGNYTFPVLLGGMGNTDEWQIGSIPRNWLVNGESVIQLEARGYIRDWDALRDKILTMIEQSSGKK